MSILQKIIETKKDEVHSLKTGIYPSLWKNNPALQAPCRGFGAALARKELSIIAEVKKASPSKGLIRMDFHPVEIAKAYEKGGAACISVLTDKNYFQGDINHLAQIRKSVALPLLRKDFIIDDVQLTEAKMNGADAVLLIAEVLSTSQIKELTLYAQALHMDVLLETHHASELEKIDFSVNSIIGINNRDLNTFITDINTTLNIAKLLPKHVIVVSESGIENKETVQQINRAGIHAVLVGEHFMRVQDISAALAEMKEWAHEN
ncbi:MAG: indole-3-glycerol phosphate synthase TrpC [Ignavibacteriales bacterium]|nr:indole-3-glycerol phosphate synthase TrpC [Ignavibacteriales bacterium]